MSDGGGCTVQLRTHATPQLLDLVYTKSSIQKSAPGDKIAVSQEMLSRGFTSFNLGDLKSFQLAKKIISRNKVASDPWTTYLESVMVDFENLVVLATSERLNAVAPRFCEPYPQDMQNIESIRPVLAFTEDLMILSVADFNEFDLASQTGLWIHEAFRVLQILMKEPIDNKTVFQITSELLTGRIHTSNIEARYRAVGSLEDALVREEIAFGIGRIMCHWLSQRKPFKDAHTKYCPILQKRVLVPQEIEDFVYRFSKPYEDASEKARREGAQALRVFQESDEYRTFGDARDLVLTIKNLLTDNVGLMPLSEMLKIRTQKKRADLTKLNWPALLKSLEK